MDSGGTHYKELAALGGPGQWQLDNPGEGCGWGMDLTGSGCGVHVQGQAAELRRGKREGDVMLFILLFLLPSLSLPICIYHSSICLSTGH